MLLYEKQPAFGYLFFDKIKKARFLMENGLSNNIFI
jgi:hypothetical protein